ncbi:MAG: N-acetylmuramoyl-L-alanine amidase [Acidobacteriota bacterium]
MLSRCLTPLLITCCLQGLLQAAPVSQDLEVWIGERKHSVDPRIKDNQVYYPLADLGTIVGFEWNERGGLLTIEGSRGRLQLMDGRPLVRFEGEYILLSSPVWRREPNQWYVSEDFLTKVLPLVSDRSLDRFSEKRYRMEALAENQVQVRVGNFPDHVRVVFQPTLEAPVTVREFKEYIQVEFSAYLVRPEFPTTLPDHRLVSSVDFDPSNVYGAFRIQKGDLYDSFRETTLSNPTRHIIDIQTAPLELDRRGTTTRPSNSDVTSFPSGPAGNPSLPNQNVFENIITIDPGHGGGDYGVNSLEGIAEKNLTLRIANLVETQLRKDGYRAMLTRTRDVELAVEQRGSVGNYYRSLVYLSIHIGGTPSPDTRGPIVYLHRYPQKETPLEGEITEVLPADPGDLHFSEHGKLVAWEDGQGRFITSSQRLAQQLQTELNLLWGVQNKVREIPLAVLAPVSGPAILVEAGFLTNPEDQALLITLDFQERLAATISRTIKTFLRDAPGTVAQE